MKSRELLYLTFGEADSELEKNMEAVGWKIEKVCNFSDANEKIQGGKYSVGLLSVESSSEKTYAEMEVFLQKNIGMEWVGLFSPAFLMSKKSNEIIINYLFDFHTQPIDAERLLHTLGHAHGVALLRTETRVGESLSDRPFMICQSPVMKSLERSIRKAAGVDAPVMIGGASGSGKEVAAQAIHRLSRRAHGPFIAVNCAAIPGSLIQSELFGYEKGAFSGAMKNKQGYFEAAAGGSIFLDEIGDLPIDLQANLLRFLQEKTITRLGATHPIHVDVRVIAASHVNLEHAVENNKFRADLYYRLNVLTLTVPSLCERKEDILPLAEHYYGLYLKEGNPRLKGFSASAISAMVAYDWPGNVRELVNRVRRAVIMAEGRLVTDCDLGLKPKAALDEPLVLEDARAAADKKAIRISLTHTGNNLTHTARALGVSRMTLYRLLDKYKIEG